MLKSLEKIEMNNLASSNSVFAFRYLSTDGPNTYVTR